jgi:hypothetical protein
VVHANTWAAAPVCYLEDLFVEKAARRHGGQRPLLAALGREASWHTAADNATA